MNSNTFTTTYKYIKEPAHSPHTISLSFLNRYRLFSPICLGVILTYFASLNSDGPPTVTRERALWNAFGIIVLTFLSIISVHPFSLNNIQLGTRMRVGCTSMIYKKALKIKKSTSVDDFNGRVINLMTNDVARLDFSACLIHCLWKGPIELALMGYVMSLEIGYFAWLGCAFLLCFLPLQGTYTRIHE